VMVISENSLCEEGYGYVLRIGNNNAGNNKSGQNFTILNHPGASFIPFPTICYHP
jgi:hypothetical protein